MDQSNEIKELDVVALLDNLPEDNLRAGQTGTVVFVHPEGSAYEVEFPLTARKSIVATVERDRLLKLRGLPRKMPSVPS